MTTTQEDVCSVGGVEGVSSHPHRKRKHSDGEEEGMEEEGGGSMDLGEDGGEGQGRVSQQEAVC